MTDERNGRNKMSKFKAGQRVRVAEAAVYHYGSPSASAGSEATVHLDGLDPDGDVVLNFDGKYDWAAPEFVTLIDDEDFEDFEDFEDEKDKFKPGDRVRVIDDGGGNPVEVGEYGTVFEVDNYVLTTGERLIYVEWDKGNQCGLFDRRLEKVEEVEGNPAVKEGDLIRVIDAYGYTSAGYVPVGTLARVLDPEARVGRLWVEREGSTEWPTRFYVDTWEAVPEVTEGDNDDNPVGEGLFISGPLSFTIMDETVDVVNHPPYYKFPNGARVIDISENLTSNGGQAVQYIARSTRLDGNNKGDVLGDLRKARRFIDWEIERVENQG